MFRTTVLFSLIATLFTACDGQQPQECTCTCPPAPVCAPAPAPVATATAQLVEQAVRSGQEFQLSVYYARPLPEAIVLGKFDSKNDDITHEHFPPSADEQGTAARSMRLFSFGRTVSSDDAIAGMSAEGYRPATLRELLAFAAMFPEEQRVNPIVALGSSWEGFLRRNVPYLDGWNSKRSLNLHRWSYDWVGDWRFLAVRKS